MHITDLTASGVVRKDVLPAWKLWNIAKGLGL